MSYGEIAHQVKNSRHPPLEKGNIPDIPLLPSMLHRLPEFVISARFPCSINPVAAVLMLKRCSSGRRNKQRKGADDGESWRTVF